MIGRLHHQNPQSDVDIAVYAQTPSSPDFCLRLASELMELPRTQAVDVVDLQAATPKDYEDITRLLSDRRVISSELAVRLKGLGGFRNILVHDDLDVDP